MSELLNELIEELSRPDPSSKEYFKQNIEENKKERKKIERKLDVLDKKISLRRKLEDQLSKISLNYNEMGKYINKKNLIVPKKKKDREKIIAKFYKDNLLKRISLESEKENKEIEYDALLGELIKNQEALKKFHNYKVTVKITYMGKRTSTQAESKEYKQTIIRTINISSDATNKEIEDKLETIFIEEYKMFIVDEILSTRFIRKILDEPEKLGSAKPKKRPMRGQNLIYNNFKDVSKGNNCVTDCIKFWAKNPENRCLKLLKKPLFLKPVSDDEWKKFRETHKIPGSHFIVNNKELILHHQVQKEDSKKRILNTANVNGHMYILGESHKIYIPSTTPKKKDIIMNPTIQQIKEEDNKRYGFDDPEKMNELYNLFLKENYICSSKFNHFGPMLNENYQISQFYYKKNYIKLVDPAIEDSIKLIEKNGIENYYSTLKESTLEFFHKYKIGPICFSKGTSGSETTVDIKKCYTRALYSLQDIYIFNELCDFVPTNKFEGQGFYLINTTDYENFPNGPGVYPDYCLKESSQIVAYLKPIRIVPNIFKKIIEKSYNSLDYWERRIAFLDGESKKYEIPNYNEIRKNYEEKISSKALINNLTGLLERRKITKRYKAYFNNSIDIFNWRGNGWFSSPQKEGNFYTCISSETLFIKKNGWTIKQQIYGQVILIFNEMLKNLNLKRSDLLRVHVDSATFNKKFIDPPKTQIGNYIFNSYELEKTKVTKPTQLKEYRTIALSKSKQTKIIKYKNVIENEKEIIAALNSKDNILLTGRGKSGKTTIIKKWGKGQIIVPQHTGRLNYETSNTIQSFIQQDERNWKHVPILIIDEIYMCSSIDAILILRYYEKFHPKLIGLGCPEQNTGLDFCEDIYPVEVMKFPNFYNLFDVKIELQESLDQDMINRADCIKSSPFDLIPKKYITDLKSIQNYAITRSNALRERINAAKNKNWTIGDEVRPKSNIIDKETKKLLFIKYEPCIITSVVDDSCIIKSKLKETERIVNKENLEFNYASTFRLSQSLRLGKYSIVLEQNQFEYLTDNEKELIFTRDPDWECLILIN